MTSHPSRACTPTVRTAPLASAKVHAPVSPSGRCRAKTRNTVNLVNFPFAEILFAPPQSPALSWSKGNKVEEVEAPRAGHAGVHGRHGALLGLAPRGDAR